MDEGIETQGINHIMIIYDTLYGEFEIAPVIEALIASAPVQRLKKIHQGGAIFLIAPAINHSRYDHSIGVMYLVKHLGGNIEEQIAALLHDVSHTAFSHVVDYLFEREGEDYHEDLFRTVILESAIPDILLSHGYHVEDLFTKAYPLLEQPYPYLCADRVDYALRDSYMAGLMTIDEIRQFMRELTIRDGRITCENNVKLQWFRAKFRQLNEDYFRKPEYLYVNHHLADLLHHALYLEVIREEDLMGSDDELLALLNSHRLTHGGLSAIGRLLGFDTFDVEAAAAKLKTREL
ncbi:HD domain-containing protein [Olivibacter sp. SDN3]|uniref:HD domain-containing protein n=1 Tax=Olivibacter sp. SDN3 TaxID=2764720 RepID=UPI001650D861|nr:HD domain-containing protein [Olivibacter sp. SDN3]QNL47845.1 HD domain-containing protein [Olivibacter sp. SDN3]